jgi:hypothetical protein
LERPLFRPFFLDSFLDHLWQTEEQLYIILLQPIFAEVSVLTKDKTQFNLQQFNIAQNKPPSQVVFQYSSL